MSPAERVTELIEQYGGVLIRQWKHEVWRFPDGRQFVRAATPSDHRSEMNQLHQLRRILGLPIQGAGPGPRRQRTERPGRMKTINITAAPPRTSFQDALRSIKGS